MSDLGVACGNCGGPILMVTCDSFRGTGHEWTLVSLCLLCRATHWIESGCVACRREEDAHDRIVPIFDADLNLIDRGQE